jgi:hypothetical protein
MTAPAARARSAAEQAVAKRNTNPSRPTTGIGIPSRVA